MKTEEYESTIENLQKAREEAQIGHEEKRAVEKTEAILRVLKGVSEGNYEKTVEGELEEIRGYKI